MGNCMETCIHREEVEQNHQQQETGEKEAEIISQKEIICSSKETSGMRLKIVLTKEELEWLLLQLKNKEGKRLEDVLDEIERSRQRSVVGSWKPSLESIDESPEVPDDMIR